MKKTDSSFQTFIEKNTIPLYAHFDKAHQEGRVQSIIKQSEPRSLFGKIVAETDRLYALQQAIKDGLIIRQLVERI